MKRDRSWGPKRELGENARPWRDAFNAELIDVLTFLWMKAKTREYDVDQQALPLEAT